MKNSQYLDNLKDSMKLLDDACKWLERSFNICSKIGVKENYSPEEHDAFETLASRYSRVSDMILQKVFRSVEIMELEDEGTLIDTLNRMEKRGIISSVEEAREIRELRNQISHEYMQKNLIKIFQDVLNFIPRIFHIITNLKKYIEKYQ